MMHKQVICQDSSGREYTAPSKIPCNVLQHVKQPRSESAGIVLLLAPPTGAPPFTLRTAGLCLMRLLCLPSASPPASCVAPALRLLCGPGLPLGLLCCSRLLSQSRLPHRLWLPPRRLQRAAIRMETCLSLVLTRESAIEGLDLMPFTGRTSHEDAHVNTGMRPSWKVKNMHKILALSCWAYRCACRCLQRPVLCACWSRRRMRLLKSTAVDVGEPVFWRCVVAAPPVGHHDTLGHDCPSKFSPQHSHRYQDFPVVTILGLLQANA